MECKDQLTYARLILLEINESQLRPAIEYPSCGRQWVSRLNISDSTRRLPSIIEHKRTGMLSSDDDQNASHWKCQSQAAHLMDWVLDVCRLPDGDKKLIRMQGLDGQLQSFLNMTMTDYIRCPAVHNAVAMAVR